MHGKPDTTKKEKYFWSYLTAMADLGISRRTLQRWLDDLDIDSLEFEDHLKVFLKLPDIQRLREYGRVMKTRNQSLIARYRDAIEAGNIRRLARINKDVGEFYACKEKWSEDAEDWIYSVPREKDGV